MGYGSSSDQVYKAVSYCEEQMTRPEVCTLWDLVCQHEVATRPGVTQTLTEEQRGKEYTEGKGTQKQQITVSERYRYQQSNRKQSNIRWVAYGEIVIGNLKVKTLDVGRGRDSLLLLKQISRFDVNNNWLNPDCLPPLYPGESNDYTYTTDFDQFRKKGQAAEPRPKGDSRAVRAGRARQESGFRSSARLGKSPNHLVSCCGPLSPDQPTSVCGGREVPLSLSDLAIS
ncbi:hypothetical protein J6590_022555 [Homalodisca vitripennis]|nr:hypothetical protein J6590_022555 [Homalodisca vitripennis]